MVSKPAAVLAPAAIYSSSTHTVHEYTEK